MRVDRRTLSRLGVGAGFSPIPDPDAKQGNCGLCGGYHALNRLGHCGREECTGKVLDRLREMSDGEDIPGLYFEIDGMEMIVWEAVDEVAEQLGLHLYLPDPDGFKGRDPYLCTDCDEWAKPNDTLCITHRAEIHRAQENARKSQREANRRNGARRTKGRNKRPQSFGNGIRGLDKIK